MSRRWLGPVILAGMWAFAAVAFRWLPAEVPTHWNLAGEVDGWMPRFPGAFIAPLVGTLLWGIMVVQPRIDPRREEVERSTGTRFLLAEIVLVFLATLEVLATGVALGWPIDMARVMWPAMGLLFVLIGNYLPRVRPNWFVGVRTPWTLDSDGVWRATHRVAGWAFVAAGVLVAGAALLPQPLRVWVAAGALVLAALVPTAYSYLRWRRESRGGAA